MISQAIVQKMHLATCAIGVLQVDEEQHMREILSPHFLIKGTGFVVAPEYVITNRHVLEGIQHMLEREGYEHDSLKVQFVSPAGNSYQIHFNRVGDVGLCDGEDIGLLHVPGLAELGERQVICGSSQALTVGQEIAMLGYADGEALQLPAGRRDEALYRFGPVLQQGHISAIAPIYGAAVVTQLLLDIRTTGGMSGSPVFDPATGEVVGIHFQSNGTTTAMALPLTKTITEHYLGGFVKNRPASSQVSV